MLKQAMGGIAYLDCSYISVTYQLHAGYGGYRLPRLQLHISYMQVMGGIAYLDGTWFKADAPFYNTSSEQVNGMQLTCN